MSDFQEGAVWNAVDANGETALDTAVAAGQHEAVSELIQLETYEKNVTDSENANDERLGIESGVLMDGTSRQLRPPDQLPCLEACPPAATPQSRPETTADADARSCCDAAVRWSCVQLVHSGLMGEMAMGRGRAATGARSWR